MSDPKSLVKVLRVRVKDKHAATLRRMAQEVNFVWNYVNELSHTHTVRTGKFLSSYDIHPYLSGATKEGLTIHADSLDAIREQFVIRRRQFKKAKLRWRVSDGPRRSLGWVPFKAKTIFYRNGQLRYKGVHFSIWDSYGLAGYELRAGSFSEDSRGRWYANIAVEVKPTARAGQASIGIDLGLKDFACMSDGTKVEAQRIYRGAEAALATAQRANKANRVKAISAQIKNRRGDFLHKLSSRLVKEHGAIFVGNVDATKLTQTKMAKSVLDAGWSSFRTMLQYKSHQAGVLFEEVNEAYSTVTCSACGSRSGPGGLKGLRIREWVCGDCGETHDRDTNAALNILARGHASLAEGATK
jgi:putative transposase